MGEIEMEPYSGTGIEESSKNPRSNLTVEISLKKIGPSPPSRLIVPSSIKVHDLRKLIAQNGNLPIETLRLIWRGNVLHDSKNGDDTLIQLNNGDSLIVATKPKPPPKHVHDDFDDDDEDELRFQLPQSISGWKRRLFITLRFAIIFYNLGHRQPGDVSAYSIFNEDFRELPGTLNAERLDRDIRAGQF